MSDSKPLVIDHRLRDYRTTANRRQPITGEPRSPINPKPQGRRLGLIQTNREALGFPLSHRFLVIFTGAFPAYFIGRESGQQVIVVAALSTGAIH